MMKLLSKSCGVLTAVTLLLPALVLSQSVIVTPKKVVYRRTGTGVRDVKRTFEVRYPIFSGRISRAALRNLKNNTDYWTLFETTLQENLKADDWLSSMDYQVKYNKNNLLAIWLTMEGVGAYPDGATRYLVLDLRTGNRVTLEDLFDPSKLSGLRDLIRRKMTLAESRLNKEMKEGLEFHRQDAEFHPPVNKIELKDLAGFTISDRGMTFLYDYGYPHVVQALEPSGEFFVTFSELRPYVRRDGLLARFIR